MTGSYTFGLVCCMARARLGLDGALHFLHPHGSMPLTVPIRRMLIPLRRPPVRGTRQKARQLKTARQRPLI